MIPRTPPKDKDENPGRRQTRSQSNTFTRDFLDSQTLETRKKDTINKAKTQTVETQGAQSIELQKRLVVELTSINTKKHPILDIQYLPGEKFFESQINTKTNQEKSTNNPLTPEQNLNLDKPEKPANPEFEKESSSENLETEKNQSENNSERNESQNQTPEQSHNSQNTPENSNNSQNTSNRSSITDMDELAEQIARLTITDVLKYHIPFFKGNNNELSGFINTCSMFDRLTPNNLKPILLTMIKAKITGEALAKIQPIEDYNTWELLENALNLKVKKPISYEYAHDQINMMSQKKDETLESFADRARKGLANLNEAARTISVVPAELTAYRKTHERLAIAKFTQNIRNKELKTMISATAKTSLEECIVYAMEKELSEKSSNIKKCTICNSDSHPEDECRRKTDTTKNPNTSNIMRTPPKNEAFVRPTQPITPFRRSTNIRPYMSNTFNRYAGEPNAFNRYRNDPNTFNRYRGEANTFNRYRNEQSTYDRYRNEPSTSERFRNEPSTSKAYTGAPNTDTQNPTGTQLRAWKFNTRMPEENEKNRNIETNQHIHRRYRRTQNFLIFD